MQTPSNDRVSGCGGVTAGELFNVVLVYDDPASALRGLALYQRLVTELGLDCDCNLSVWKFAVLGVSRLAEISTAEAAAADLVIVCTRDEAALPQQAQAWFHRWLELKGHDDCALVMLDGADHERPEPARPGGFFHDLARYGRVSVFPSVTTPVGSAAPLDGRTGCAPRQNPCAWQSRNGFSMAATARPGRRTVFSSNT